MYSRYIIGNQCLSFTLGTMEMAFQLLHHFVLSHFLLHCIDHLCKAKSYWQRLRQSCNLFNKIRSVNMSTKEIKDFLQWSLVTQKQNILCKFLTQKQNNVLKRRLSFTMSTLLKKETFWKSFIINIFLGSCKL